MARLHIFDHPLMHNKLSYLRDKTTPSYQFRNTVRELAMLMAYEVTNDLPVYNVDVETPLAIAHCQRVEESKLVIVPILRAGLGMVDGFLQLLPACRVGHIGMSRDEETHIPEAYYHKLPKDIADCIVIVVDPMLATGGSAVDAITFLKEQGVTNIKFVGILGAQAGIDHLQKSHPDVSIYLAEKDEVLNENAYIVPGLGDAGDRIFGTV